MSVPGYDAETGAMDFSLALREMKKGRKVRRRSWEPDTYVHIVNDDFKWDSGHGADFTARAILATDWEEVL